jgi:hypothetical protein
MLLSFDGRKRSGISDEICVCGDSLPQTIAVDISTAEGIIVIIPS